MGCLHEFSRAGNAKDNPNKEEGSVVKKKWTVQLGIPVLALLLSACGTLNDNNDNVPQDTKHPQNGVENNNDMRHNDRGTDVNDNQGRDMRDNRGNSESDKVRKYSPAEDTHDNENDMGVPSDDGFDNQHQNPEQ